MCDTLVHSCCKEYQKDKNNDNTSANSSFGLKKIVLQWTKGYLYAGVRKNQTKRDEIGGKMHLNNKISPLLTFLHYKCTSEVQQPGTENFVPNYINLATFGLEIVYSNSPFTFRLCCQAMETLPSRLLL